MLETVEKSHRKVSKFVGMGSELVQDDLSDLREHEKLFESGHTMTVELQQMLVLGDELRKQQMLVKFYLQLRTYSSDNIVKMQRPFNLENTEAHLKDLKEHDAAYMIIEPPVTLQIHRER